MSRGQPHGPVPPLWVSPAVSCQARPRVALLSHWGHCSLWEPPSATPRIREEHSPAATPRIQRGKPKRGSCTSLCQAAAVPHTLPVPATLTFLCLLNDLPQGFLQAVCPQHELLLGFEDTRHWAGVEAATFLQVLGVSRGSLCHPLGDHDGLSLLIQLPHQRVQLLVQHGTLWDAHLTQHPGISCCPFSRGRFLVPWALCVCLGTYSAWALHDSECLGTPCLLEHPACLSNMSAPMNTQQGHRPPVHTLPAPSLCRGCATQHTPAFQFPSNPLSVPSARPPACSPLPSCKPGQLQPQSH